MNRIVIICALMLAAFLLYGDVPELTSEDLAALIEEEEEFFLVDVRTPEEYSSGAIPTAVNIPYDTIDQDPPTKDRSALIVVYCRSGVRSGIAKRRLEELGYSRVIDFGGITNWEGELVNPEKGVGE